ncbi:hypothetical protein LI177_02950 [bacterium 210820-DFI.6.37]|nr:hypothetical protein [bacterium 210820-DFI.6.37]
MALKKDIRQDDGVVTNYHRILFLDLVINSHVSIAVLSYIDNTARTDEKGGATTTVSSEDAGEIDIPYQPYQRSVTYETDYDPEMTIEKAYAYLKTLPEFSGAEDI